MCVEELGLLELGGEEERIARVVQPVTQHIDPVLQRDTRIGHVAAALKINILEEGVAKWRAARTSS